MTDEGQVGEPMDAIEMANAMAGAAQAAKAMYDELCDAGFQPFEAMKLVGAFLHGTAGGKLG